ncbi:unnamed protein product, partial [Cyprideis torosa]
MTMEQQGIFITGTDTDVGKTYVGSRWVQHLWESGHKITARKPAESGCTQDAQGQRAGQDALAYYHACQGKIPLTTINAFRYLASLAPPAAADLEGQQLTIAGLADACRCEPTEYLIVEGAGGWRSPLAHDGSNADLAELLGLKVMLVATDRLGCLNHILLTLESVEKRGLEVALVVLNRMHPDQSSASNLSWLQEHLSSPVVVYEKA